ncbi:hypothetical protein ONZ45_g10627 [Pleurotus djamor]|nr:hypothetical protein ONZ45_g10627 [Pleurotus djamor]
MFSDQTMSQDATPSSQAGESRGHKRARSLGTESTKTIQGVIDVFDRFETIITNEISAADSVELRIFLFQMRFLRSALEKLLKEREKADDRYEVKAVSFSSVDESNLKEMGLESIAVLDKADFESLVKNFHPTIVKDEAALQGAVAFLGNQLVKVNNFLANRNEAAARMFIDQVLIELADYCLPHQGASTLAGWTELNIANQERPVNIRHRRFMTMLTGIVDYALGYGRDHVIKELGVAQTIAAVEKRGQHRDTFTLIEAKGLEANLWSFLAQAIAQSLVLINRQVTSDNTATCASFALSNGLKWIFGVTKVNLISSRERKDENTIFLDSIECRCSPLVAMTDINDDDGRKEIFKTLLTWVRIPSAKLWEKMEGEKVGAHVVGGQLVSVPKRPSTS